MVLKAFFSSLRKQRLCVAGKASVCSSVLQLLCIIRLEPSVFTDEEDNIHARAHVCNVLLQEREDRLALATLMLKSMIWGVRIACPKEND